MLQKSTNIRFFAKRKQIPRNKFSQHNQATFSQNCVQSFVVLSFIITFPFKKQEIQQKEILGSMFILNNFQIDIITTIAFPQKCNIFYVGQNRSYFYLIRKNDYNQNSSSSKITLQIEINITFTYNIMQKTSQNNSLSNRIAKMQELYDSIKPKQNFLWKIQDVDIGLQSHGFSQVFKEKTENRIKDNLGVSQNMQQFLELQLYQIIDFLRRKFPLVDYFRLLKNQLHLVEKIGFNQITFVDLIILLMRMTEPSDFISVVLAQQSAPIPITYSVNSNLMSNILTIKRILAEENYSLVIDIWSEEAVKKLKVCRQQQFQKIYFCQFLKIDIESFEGSSFNSNINLFKLRLPQNQQSRNILLVSLVNYENEEHQSLTIKKDFLLNIVEQDSLVIFHIDESIVKKSKQEPSVLNSFNFFVQDNTRRKIYFIQLANQYYIIQDIFQYFYKMFQQSFEKQQLFYFERHQRQRNEYEYEQDDDYFQQDYSHQQELFFQKLSQKQSQRSFHAAFLYLQHIFGNSANLQMNGEEKIRLFLEANLKRNKSQLLPFYEKSKQLYQLRMKIRNVDFEQYCNEKGMESILDLNNQIKQFQMMKQQLQEQENQIKKDIRERNFHLSQFAVDYMRFLQEDNITFQLSQQIFKEEISKKILGQLQQFRQNFRGSIRDPNLKRQQKNILANRISIDNIIQEFNYSKLMSQDTETITMNYYQKCLNNSRPFCLIDGQKNSFGNQIFQKFLKNLNQKFDKKNVFIVSFIGSNYSGKDAIINRLFPKSIRFKEDPLAKGVYMSVHQVNKKTIVVLDALGIMSMNFSITNYKYTSQQLQTEFAAFDHRLISFIIKQSDLAIFMVPIKKDSQFEQFNSFIPRQVLLAFAIYLTIIQGFAINNQQRSIPKRFIFAFSNVNNIQVDKKDVIDSLIENIEPILQKISMRQDQNYTSRSLFNKYAYLSKEDIIFLPHADSLQADRFQILAFRNKIMKHINQIEELGLSSRTIIHFYEAAKVSWQTILLTTKQIVQTISMKQLNWKQILHSRYQQFFPTIYGAIEAQVNQIYNTNQLNKRVIFWDQMKDIRDSTYSLPSIYQIYGKILDYFKENSNNSQQMIGRIKNKAFYYFKVQCLQEIENSGLVYEFIQLNFARLFNSLILEQVKNQYQKISKNYQNSFIQNQLNLLTERIHQNIINDREFIQIIYQHKVKKLYDSIFMNSQEKKTIILQEKTQIIRMFNIIIQSQIILKTFSIQSFKDYIQFDENRGLKDMYKLFNFQNQSLISSKLIEQIQNNIYFFEQLIKTIKFKNIDQIYHLVQQINRLTRQTDRQIKDLAYCIYFGQIEQFSMKFLDKIRNKQEEVYSLLYHCDGDQENLLGKKLYYNYLQQIFDDRKKKVVLNQINFKMILLGKLFKRLYNSVDQQSGEKPEIQKQYFQMQVQKYRNSLEYEL